MAEMIWDVPLQVIYTTSGAKLWRGQPDVKGSLVGTVKPEWAAFIKRAVNCHADLVAALEECRRLARRSPSYLHPTKEFAARILATVDAALAKAHTAEENRIQQQDMAEETL
jgi:hypothetical protein